MKSMQFVGDFFIITPDTLPFLLSFLALSNDIFKGSSKEKIAPGLTAVALIK